VHGAVFFGDINAEYIVSGSSQAVVMYDTPLLEKLSNKTWFNIGLDGEKAGVQYACLCGYFSANKAPQVVIQNVDAWGLGPIGAAYDNERYSPYLECDALYENLVPIDANLWRYRFIGRPRLILKGLIGQLGIADRFADDIRIRGFNPRDSPPLDRKKTIALFEASTSLDVQVGGEGERYLRRIIDLCRQHGSRIVLVAGPMWEERLKYTANPDRFNEEMKRLSAANDVTFMDFTRTSISLDHMNFYDSIHLRREAAAEFSRMLFGGLEEEKVLTSALSIVQRR